MEDLSRKIVFGVHTEKVLGFYRARVEMRFHGMVYGASAWSYGLSESHAANRANSRQMFSPQLEFFAEEAMPVATREAVFGVWDIPVTLQIENYPSHLRERLAGAENITV